MSRDTASQSSPARVVKAEPTNKISTKAAGKRKAPIESDEEEDEVMQNGEQEDPADEEEEEEVVGSSRKRARSGNPVEDEEEEEAQDPDLEDAAELFLRDVPLARDKNGYVTGSIVRIACSNFVTYTSVEFFPGPDLNMIIGPNGTGKSTIACAIAIGLGFPASVLGRQAKISGFVKNGAATGWVEIELKGKVGKKNSVIRRNIQVSDEKSTFKLDGKTATAAEIRTRMESLSVQVGNLCTFLPQDRVASFAAMSSQQLLKETQKAAGAQHLTAWHGKLIEEDKNVTQYLDTFTQAQKHLTTLETKNERVGNQVAAYHERVKVEVSLAVLALLLVTAQYAAAQKEYADRKLKRTAIMQELEALQAENKPFDDSQKGLTKMVDHYNKERSGHVNQLALANKDISELSKALQNSNDASDRVRSDLDGVKKDEKMRKKNISTLRMDIGDLEKVTAGGPPIPPETAEWDARITEIKKAVEPVNAERRAIAEEIKDVERSLRGVSTKRTNINNRLAQLQNVKTQKDLDLKKFNPNAYTALRWLRENKHKFNGVVYEPIRLVISAKDSRLADLAEASISIGQGDTFVCELQEDYERFTKFVVDEKNMRINVAQLPAGKDLAYYQNFRDSKYNPEQIKAWGFDCYALDLLDGPPAVLSYLCEVAKIHMVPVCTSTRRLDSQAIEASRVLNRWNTVSGVYSMKYSAYGARGAQTETKALPRAKFLTVSQDLGEVENCQKELAEIEEAKRGFGGQVQALEMKDAEVLGASKQLNGELAQIKKLQEDAKAPMLKYKMNISKLEAKKNSLDSQLRKPGLEAKEKALKAKMAGLTTKRLSSALKYKDAAFAACKIQERSVTTSLLLLQATTDLQAMKASSTERNQAIQDKNEELTAAKEHATEAYSQAKEYLATYNTAKESASEDVANAVDERMREGAESVEQISQAQAMEEAKLGALQPVSAAVIADWERRKVEIEGMKAKTAVAQEKLDECRATIAKVRAKWEPALRKLVGAVSQRFSRAFDEMGRLGEVRVGMDEDYDKWGIEIMCSFRETEKIKQLSATRQSGGERALATVMYLMSLAELGNSPFSLVDEINQGMDQRVERQVHNQLVATTCKDDVGQYFLITPKLLPNLNYHEKMKVLIVNNGDWLPPTLDLKLLLANKTQRATA